MGKVNVLKRCPVCGGALYVDRLMQYSIVHQLGKSGANAGRELPRTRRVTNDGPMEDYIAIHCEHGDFVTDYELKVEIPATMKHAMVSQYQDVFYIEEE